VYALLDDDGNFTNGGTKSFALTQNGGVQETVIENSEFLPYLTFATRAPDTTPPVVSLNGSGTMTLFLGQEYVEQGATWTDNYDGTGTIATPSDGEVDTSVL
jgi:hypothetical protein